MKLETLTGRFAGLLLLAGCSTPAPMGEDSMPSARRLGTADFEVGSLRALGSGRRGRSSGRLRAWVAKARSTIRQPFTLIMAALDGPCDPGNPTARRHPAARIPTVARINQ